MTRGRRAATEPTNTRPLMRTGYSWICTCGWSTERGALYNVENARDAHERYHNAHDQLQKQVNA